MRIRYLVVVVLGIAAVVLALQVAAPGSAPAGQVLDDGTIQVSAGEDGRGAWVPYRVTVRNLGDKDFIGRLLLVKQVTPRRGLPPRLSIPGVGLLVSPVGGGGRANPPDAGYQLAVALSSRHKQTYSFFAPDDFISAVVQDQLGRQVGEGVVDDRKSVAIGTYTDSATLAGALEPIRIGDLTMKVTQWNDANPFPDRAAYLSGYSAVILDNVDSGRLSKAQVASLAEFVGLGGELVIAGGGDLARTLRALPAPLVAFHAAGGENVDSLAPVAELSGLRSDIVAPVATGTLAAGASVILDTPAGRALEAETGYGSGRVVELLFDPDSKVAGAGTPSSLATLAFTQAIGRGLESIAGTAPSGRTLVSGGNLPGVLFPRPSDSPFPPLWLVASFLSVYLVVVLPVNYLFVRRVGSPTLFWVTAPAFAVAFTMISYLLGQGFQAGIRDQEIQLYRAGPDGIVSRVDFHGLAFSTRGDHQLSFGNDSLVAPVTIAYPDLSPSCLGCTFPASSGANVEEHVMPGGNPTIAERGIVYGSVRVVSSASTGIGGLDLAVHLTTINGRISGSIANIGKIPIAGLLVYTYYQGGYRSAVVAPGLAAGDVVQVDSIPTPIGDAAPNLPPGTRLTDGQIISLVADEAGRRNLSHRGQLALVGFVKPVNSDLRVDGTAPRGAVLAAFGLPVDVESATARLGDVAFPRLAGFRPESAGLFLDTYDIVLPAVSEPLVLRYDKRIYSDVEVYDWQSRVWRAGGFEQDPASPIVMLTRLDPSELHAGLVRVRVHEASLTWGSEITVRFPAEVP